MASEPRSLWNGSIVIGYVVVPIKLHSAIEDRRIHFRQVHDKDLAPVDYRRFCVEEGVEVPWDEVRMGLELDDGSVVMFEESELSVVSEAGNKAIEINGFVDRVVVEDEVIDRPYYLGARGHDQTSYAVLREALAKAEQAGVGEFTFHGRRRSVLLTAEHEEAPLQLYTLRPAATLVEESTLEPVGEPHRQLSEAEVEAARSLVLEMSGEFEPEEFPDSHREALLELIESKVRGEEPEVGSKRELPPTGDLRKALESSVELEARNGKVPAT